MLKKKTIIRALAAIKWMKNVGIIATESQKELFGFIGYFRWNEFPYNKTELKDIYESEKYKEYCKYNSINYTKVIDFLVEKGLLYIRKNGNKYMYYITKDDIDKKIEKIKEELNNYDEEQNYRPDISVIKDEDDEDNYSEFEDDEEYKDKDDEDDYLEFEDDDYLKFYDKDNEFVTISKEHYNRLLEIEKAVKIEMDAIRKVIKNRKLLNLLREILL